MVLAGVGVRRVDRSEVLPSGRRILIALAFVSVLGGCAAQDTGTAGRASDPKAPDSAQTAKATPQAPSDRSMADPDGAARSGMDAQGRHLESQSAGAPAVLLAPLAGETAAERAAGQELLDLFENNLTRTPTIRPVIDDSQAPRVASLFPVAAEQQAGAELALSGTVRTAADGRLEVTVELWQIAPRRRLDRYAYPVPTGQLRRVGHLISDAAYKRILRYYRRAIPGPGLFDSRIVYVETKQPGADRGSLAVIDQDGFNRRLIETPTDVMGAGFADGAGDVVLLSSGKVATAYLMNLVTRQTETLGRYAAMSEPPRFLNGSDMLLLAFAPQDGSAAGNRDVYLQVPPWRSPARALTRLTEHPAADYAPEVSPDDGTLVWVSERSGAPQLWIKAMGGVGERQLTRGAAGYRNPAWSPDGEAIAALESDADGSRLVLVDPGTGSIRSLAPAGADSHPSWSPNGELVAFVDESGRLAVVDVAGRRVETYATEHTVRSPGWSPLIRQSAGG